MQTSDYQRIIRENLKQYRSQLGLTQSECAEKVGIGHRHYQELERGAANPTLETLVRIASAFNLTIDRMLRLDFLHLEVPFEEFTNNCDAVFKGLDYGMGLRTLEGQVLVAALSLQTKENFSRGAVSKSVYEYLPPSMHGLFRAELECEKKLFPVATLLEIQTENAGTMVLRLYPTLLFETKERTPKCTAIYSIPPQMDCHKNYLDYVQKLLQCAGVRD